MGAVGRKPGAPTIGIGRLALHRILIEALGTGAVQFGARLVDFAQDAAGVTAGFADGREERGDVLIGADGIRPAVRAQILDLARPRYSGHTSWQAAVDFAHPRSPPDVLSVHFGPGARFISYHLAPGRVAWIAEVNSPEEVPEPRGGRKAALLAHFRGWDEPIEALIAAADEAAILRTPLYFRAPTRRWGAGRVTPSWATRPIR